MLIHAISSSACSFHQIYVPEREVYYDTVLVLQRELKMLRKQGLAALALTFALEGSADAFATFRTNRGHSVAGRVSDLSKRCDYHVRSALSQPVIA